MYMNTVYGVPGIAYTVRRTVYGVHSTLHRCAYSAGRMIYTTHRYWSSNIYAQRTVYGVHCASYIVRRKLYSVHYTLYTVHSVHRTMTYMLIT